MKTKGLKRPVIIIAIGLVVAIVACLLANILKTPTITEQDFHYSATYQMNGETKTVDGVYRVRFRSVGEGIAPKERYYEGFYLSDPTAGTPKEHILAKQDDLELQVVFIFTDDYLMGDGDRGEVYSVAIPEPYLAAYDGMGVEYSDLETIEKFGAELVSWETPQPIENDFVFAGFSILHTGSMAVMLLAGLLTMIACMIFVKKDLSVSYKVLDKISIVFNCIVGIVALPFMTVVISFMGIYVSGDEIIYQLDLCIPAITMFTIAASIVLRRKGFTKTGFFVQFAGPVMFTLLAALEAIVPV